MNPKDNNSFSGIDTSLAKVTANVRKRGISRLLIGAVGASIIAGITLWLLPALGVQFTPKGLMIAAIPGAYALVGLLESITGVGYGDWARRWDSLKGWQRGILGFVIVGVFFVLLMVVLASVLS